MQMINTINHTQRRKILRSEVNVTLQRKEGVPPSIDVRFSLSPEKFPCDAAVYVEAYRGNTLQRFDFGTVATIRPPADCSLSAIDLSGPTNFRVRVVDRSEHLGRLIGSAENLKAEGDSDDENRASLIVIKALPLGQQIWKIEFVDDGKPLLCINNRVPDAIGQLRNNPIFQALVLPAALRHVLTFFLWNGEAEEGSIQRHWLDFAEFLGGEKPFGEDPVALLAWVDEVVERFSEKFELCDLLLLKMEEATQ